MRVLGLMVASFEAFPFAKFNSRTRQYIMSPYNKHATSTYSNKVFAVLVDFTPSPNNYVFLSLSLDCDHKCQSLGCGLAFQSSTVQETVAYGKRAPHQHPGAQSCLNVSVILDTPSIGVQSDNATEA